MAKIKVILLIFAFSLSVSNVNSYELSDLIKILIEKNNTSSSFKYDELIDEKNLLNADSIYVPQIDYSYSFSNSTTSANDTNNLNSHTNTISASINLYNGGFSQLNLLTTQTQNEAFDYLRIYQKELLVKELINGYNNLQSLILKKNNQNQNLEFYNKRVLEAEILFNANRITKTDLLDFQNELVNAESLLYDYDRQIDNLMLQVNKLLDLDIKDEDVNFSFSINIPSEIIEKKIFSELMNSSYGTYLNVIEKSYMPELEMGKKDLLPSVDLSYSLSDTDKFSNSVNHRRSSALSLTFSMPIYNGYKDENNFDIKEYEYQKKLLDHKDLKKDMLNTYLESWNNYDFYNLKINNQKKIIDTLELKLKGDEILYKSQKISVTRLIETKNDLNDANNVLLDLITQQKYYLLDIIILNNDLDNIINGLG